MTVFHNDDDYVVVGQNWIDRLKATALASPQRRARLCLHHSDDDMLHEMIIALARDCLFPPHKHLAKSESFHVIEGFLSIIIFEDDGTPFRLFRLGAQRGICYRMCKPRFHAVLPLSNVVVYHEVTNGPFVKNDTVLASWAPTEPKELRAFLEKVDHQWESALVRLRSTAS